MANRTKCKKNPKGLPIQSRRRQLKIESLENRRLLAFTVTNVNDSGAGSLRQAIIDANATPIADLIQFNIAGPSRIISTTSALPTITASVVIDATTQPGYAGIPVVELNGSTAGNSDGLRISSGSSTVRGLVIRNFTNFGIVLTSGDNNIIEGNYIGTNLGGTSAQGNGGGLLVEAASAANRIGSDGNGVNDAAERNVLSGNRGSGLVIVGVGSNNNVVRGNLIGTNAAGTAAVANAADGIYLETASGTLISGNTVSGNGRIGIYARGALYTGGVGGTGTVIVGNMIGTNATGIAVLGNATRGIQIDASSLGTRVGTDGDGVNDSLERNVISGNGAEGVAVGVRGTDDTIIRGNYIGTDVTGELDFGNVGSGVVLWEWFYSPTSEGSPKRAVVQDNLISGNNGIGVHIAGPGSDSHRIFGNKIGTNATGTTSVPNGAGVLISASSKLNVVGTNGDGVNDSLERNIISGNGDYGIAIIEAGTNNNVVAANYIGVDFNGTLPLPNRGNAGVLISGSASNNRIGTDGNGVSDVAERNVIAGNTQEGIQIEGSTTTGTIVAGNWIGLAASGTTAIPNARSGIGVFGAIGSRIGTNGDGINDSAEGNVISGNTNSGALIVSGASGSIVSGNYIGVDPSGNVPIPNIEGVHVVDSFNTKIQSNVISGNTVDGVFLQGGAGTSVARNTIGTNAAGTVAIGNGNHGVRIERGAVGTIVGTDGDGVDDTTEGNLISGNTDGVSFWTGGATGTVIAGNRIGTNALGTAAIGNRRFGIWVNSGSINTRIGTDGNGRSDAAERNVISGNVDIGILVESVGTDRTAIAGNYVGLDASGAVAVPNRGNAGIYVWQSATNTRIGTDGNGVGDTAERNVISGNLQEGIQVDSVATTGTVIAGNYIGTNADGTAAIGNAYSGILVWGGAKNTRIGTDGNGSGDLAEQNVISGNAADGIQIQHTGTDSTIVAGNLVGTDKTGTIKLGNALSGVAVFNGPARTRIGTDGSNDAFNSAERNVISGNFGDGVFVANANTTGVSVAGNFIGLDLTGASALGNGNNGVTVLSGVKDTRIGTDGNGIADDIERNIVAANGHDGIQVKNSGTDRTIIAGNYLGTDKNGTGNFGNVYSGVAIFDGPSNTRVGTDSSSDAFNSSERNIIGFNGTGVYNVDAATNGTLIAGNYIGVDPTGNTAIPNNDAIYLQTAVNTKIDSNVLSGNNGSGIYLRGALFTGGVGGTGTVFTGNKVGTNAAGTAILGNKGWGMLIDAGSKGTRVGTDGDGVNDELERNIISGNALDGIAVGVRETNDTNIRGNYIGTDITGELDFGNSGNGVMLVEWFFTESAGAPKRAVVVDNVISGNTGGGVLINGAGSDSHRISGNKIGTNKTGMIAVANGNYGIRIAGGAKGSTIGTNGDGVGDSVEGNVISGNSGQGIRVSGAGTDDSIVAGNLIGVNALGTSAIPNTNIGLLIDGGALRTRIGTDGNGNSDLAERNTISGNTAYGVLVSGSGTNDSIVAGNYIGTDITGSTRIGNSNFGVSVQGDARNTRIGTDGNNLFDSNERNVISGNVSINVFLAFGAPGTIVAGNYVGINATGSTSIGNGFAGVELWDGANNIRIGTDGNGIGDELERNVISGHSGDGITIFNPTYSVNTTANNSIAGNFIGLNANGTAAIANTGNGIGIYLGPSNTRIGTDGSNDAFNSNERNVISGNGGNGIFLRDSITSGTRVAGNWIGVNAAGNTAIPNADAGISILRAVGTQIGTNADGIADDIERNVVSGNRNNGIQIQGGIQEVFGLAQVDQMIAGTMGSRTNTGTISQADVSDSTSPSNGNWTNNNPVPGGGGDNYGVVSTGVLQVNTAGPFSFAIAGNEGGRLKIDGVTIINDDSVHSHSARYGSVTLSAGPHAFEWIGFEGTGQSGWELSVAVGAGNTTGISAPNGWKVIGDSSPHAQIGLVGTIQVTAYYSNQLVATSANIAGNYVGLNTTGTAPLGNGSNGIRVSQDALNNSISSNVIAFNTSAGVRMDDIPLRTQFVRDNQIHHNAIGIDLGFAGPTANDPGDIDGVRNAPVFTKSHILNGSLVLEGYARPGTEFDIYLTSNYANGQGQGERILATFVEGSLQDQDTTTGTYGPLVNGRPVGSDTTNRFKFTVPLASLPVPLTVGSLLTAHTVGPASEFSIASTVVIEPSVERIKINDGSNSRSQVTSLSIDFKTALDLVRLADAFVLTNIDTGIVVGNVSVAGSTVNGKTTALLTFSGASTVTRGGTGALGNSLANGNYRLDIQADKIRAIDTNAAMNADFVFGGQTASATNNDQFFRLLGDANGDGVLNGIDLNAIIPSLFNPLGYRSDLDTNGDGVINGIDLNALIPTLFGQGRR